MEVCEWVAEVLSESPTPRGGSALARCPASPLYLALALIAAKNTSAVRSAASSGLSTPSYEALD